jgi:hypothetical protein
LLSGLFSGAGCLNAGFFQCKCDVQIQANMTEAKNEHPVLQGDAAKLAIMRQLSLAIDVLLIGGCVYLLASDVTNALAGTTEVSTRGGAFLVNLSATFALLHRGMALLRRFRPVSPARKSAGVNRWSLALVLLLPLFVASMIERSVHIGHRARLDALVADISTRTARAITINATVRAADLAALRGPYLQALTVRTDSGAFLLSARVPALDADGYLARYSSTEKVWYLDPYGVEPETAPVFDANGPRLVCRLDSQAFRCEQHAP